MSIFPVSQEVIMESLQLSIYDFVVVGIFFLFIGRGAWLGLLKQIVPLLALSLGYIVASRYHAELFPFLADLSTNPTVVFVSACVLLFIATYVVAALAAKAMASVIQVTVTPWFDRTFGAVMGGVKAVIVIIFLHIILGTIIAPENQLLRTCQTCGTVNQLAEVTRKIIRDESLQEALRQREPAIAIETIQDFMQPQQAPDQEPAITEEFIVEPEYERTPETQ